MGDSVFPLGDAQPTVEAISAFFQAYLEILESHYGFPAKKLSDRQLEELKNLLVSVRGLYVSDESVIRRPLLKS